jgi:NCS1 family nucleobase:cation symporter-1
LFKLPGEGQLVDVSWPATIAFVVGMVATWSFEYGMPTWLQGPAAKAIGGIDLSWLAGSVVAAVVYVVALSISGRGVRTAQAVARP